MGLTLGSTSLTLSLIKWTSSERMPPQAGPYTVLQGTLPTNGPEDPASDSSGFIHPRQL